MPLDDNRTSTMTTTMTEKLLTVCTTTFHSLCVSWHSSIGGNGWSRSRTSHRSRMLRKVESRWLNSTGNIFRRFLILVAWYSVRYTIMQFSVNGGGEWEREGEKELAIVFGVMRWLPCCKWFWCWCCWWYGGKNVLELLAIAACFEKFPNTKTP